MSEKLIEISSIVGGSVLAGWDQNKTNPGATFLNGMSTSVFAASDAVSTTANVAIDNLTNNINAPQQLYSTGQELITTVQNYNYAETAKTIKNAVINYIKDDLGTFTQDTTKKISTEMTTAFSTYLIQRTAYWTAATSKTSIQDFLSDMMSTSDDAMDKMEEKLNDATKNEKLEKATSTIGALNAMLSDVVSGAQTGMDSILKYMNAGPDYIESTINKYLNTVLTPVKKEITKKADDAIAEMYDASETLAKSAGTTAGAKVSEKTKKLAQKQKAKIEKGKITVISFAKSALDLVTKKAMALIGM